MTIDRKRAPIAETFIIEGLRQRGYTCGKVAQERV